MNGRFTQKAQNALNFSLKSARELGHTYIGSEHLLLGIINENESVAAKVLLLKNFSFQKAKDAVISISGKGSESTANTSDMTPCLKKIIEESANLAKKYNHDEIDFTSTALSKAVEKSLDKIIKL